MSEAFDREQDAMIELQLVTRGISDRRVLDAMRAIPRHLFVDPQLEGHAYDDRALPIACEQTISQPYIVAIMTQALELEPGARVLEIGTGSGYQSAVLAAMGAEVFSIERHALLAQSAADRMNLLRRPHVHIRVGDGRLGWPEESPFDRVVITAAADRVPPLLWEQVRNGGLLIAPLGSPQQQTLQRASEARRASRCGDFARMPFRSFSSGGRFHRRFSWRLNPTPTIP